MGCQMLVERKGLTLREHFSADFALHARFIGRPRAMRHDVTRVFKFAAECFVAFAAVEELVAPLEMKF